MIAALALAAAVAQIPPRLPDARLLDSDGRPVALRSVLPSDGRLLLAVARYRCSSSCGTLLRQLPALASAIPSVKVVAIGPDSGEGPVDASRRRAASAQGSIEFLTGSAAEVGSVLQFLGYSSGDSGGAESEHPAGLFVIDAEGVVSARLSPLASAAEVVRAISQTSAKEYTPAPLCRPLGDALARYWPAMQFAVRVFAVAVFVAVAAMLAGFWRRELRGVGTGSRAP